MIESVIGDGASVPLAVPDEVRAGFAALRAATAQRSRIVWGEHCSECAYPTCYASCAFYTPRADLHCRRFEGGFEPVEGLPGAHRVRFRKWGKIEGRGPVGLRAVADERALGQAPAVLPYALRRSICWRGNERAKAASERGDLTGADGLVLETWAADGRAHALTVTVLEVDGPGLFQAQVEATPAYGRTVLPLSAIAARVPLDRPYLIQIEPVGEAEGREIVFGLCDFVRLDPALAAPAPAQTAAGKAVRAPVKVVVWDLDETLWTGTLAEDGAAGVKPRRVALDLIRALDERGVLQSIASKNDEAEALAALGRFGLAEYFLHPQIGWGPKSDSVRRIAAALDLGLDSVVFLDDQPFERGEVTAACPAVRAVTHEAVEELVDHPWFRLPVTAESRARRALYQAEAVRRRIQEEAGTDYLAFLRGCDITLDARPLEAADVERAYELSQRTNQLNFRGTKFTREQAAALVAGERLALSLRCSDRFGDDGLIGLAVADLKAGVLEDFFMSCRVQRKRVEQASFALLQDAMLAAGAPEFRVRFAATERNGASVKMLGELGFAQGADGDWTRPLGPTFAEADVVRLAAPALREAA